MFLALNTQPPQAVVHIAAFMSIGLSLLVVWVCTIATGHYDHRLQLRRAGRQANTKPARHHSDQIPTPR
jgi:hypothetical protein